MLSLNDIGRLQQRLSEIQAGSRLTKEERRHLQALLHPRKTGPSRAMRKGPTAAQRKASKAGRHTRETARIWDFARARADDGCGFLVGELCGQHIDRSAVLAHLNGGVGRRRQTQSIANVVIEHPECNTDMDAHPLAWIDRVKAHCARYGYPLPERYVKLEAKRELEAALRGEEAP